MKSIFAALLVAALSPASASAADLAYGYLEGGYTRASVVGLNEGGDGFGLDGSVKYTEHFFLEGGLQGNAWDTHQDYIEKVYAERDYLRAGWHVAVSDDVDAIFRLGIMQVNVSSSNPDFLSSSQHGYEVSLGLRASLPAGFELEGDVGADDAELVYRPPADGVTADAFAEGLGETYTTVTLRYHLAERVLLGLSYTDHRCDAGEHFSAAMRAWFLAARWDF